MKNIFLFISIALLLSIYWVNGSMSFKADVEGRNANKKSGSEQQSISNMLTPDQNWEQRHQNVEKQASKSIHKNDKKHNTSRISNLSKRSNDIVAAEEVDALSPEEPAVQVSEDTYLEVLPEELLILEENSVIDSGYQENAIEEVVVVDEEIERQLEVMPEELRALEMED